MSSARLHENCLVGDMRHRIESVRIREWQRWLGFYEGILRTEYNNANPLGSFEVLNAKILTPSHRLNLCRKAGGRFRNELCTSMLIFG
jgi:hypothetical protein